MPRDSEHLDAVIALLNDGDAGVRIASAQAVRPEGGGRVVSGGLRLGFSGSTVLVGTWILFWPRARDGVSFAVSSHLDLVCTPLDLVC